MKRFILLVTFLFSFLAFAQKPKVDYIRWKPMTTVERDALLLQPGDRWEIYNTNTDQKEIWNGTSWVPVSNGSGGDNLGSHEATQNLDMDGNNINNINTASATEFVATDQIIAQNNITSNGWLNGVNINSSVLYRLTNPVSNNIEINDYTFETLNGNFIFKANGGSNGSSVPIWAAASDDLLLELPRSTNAAIDAGSLDVATTKRWVQDYVTSNGSSSNGSYSLYFDESSTFSILPQAKDAILKIEIFGAVESDKNYAIREWRYDDTGGRNFIGVYEYDVSTNTVGDRVSIWDDLNYTYPPGTGRRIDKVLLSEDNSSGIEIKITLDFSKLPNGISTFGGQNVNVFKFSDELIDAAKPIPIKANSTYTFNVNGVNSQLITPLGYDSEAKPSYTLMFIHGNGGTFTDSGSTGFKSFCANNNIAIISTQGQDEVSSPFTSNASGWGNYVQLQRYVSLYKYAQDHFNISSNVILVGASMGGLVAGQFMYNKPFPITACFMVGPVPDLSYIFNNGGNSRKEAIRNSFGMSSDGSDDGNLENFIQGYDWFDLGMVDLSGTKYKFGFPRFYIVTGTGDSTFTTDFGGTAKYNEIINAIESSGGFVNYDEIPNVSHAASECYDLIINNSYIKKELGLPTTYGQELLNSGIFDAPGGSDASFISGGINLLSDGNSGSSSRPRIEWSSLENGAQYRLTASHTINSGNTLIRFYNGSSFELADASIQNIDITFTANGTVWYCLVGTNTFDVDVQLSLKKIL
jgi:pimeloyl-ACP methyl ester carboxylesterase